MSPRTNQILQAAGWSPGRLYDPGQQLHALERQGFRLFPALEEILHSLGGLTISWLREDMLHDYGIEWYDAIEFRADSAAEWDVVASQIAEWERRAGEQLTPFACHPTRLEIWLVAPSKTVYVTDGGQIQRMGHDIWDALDATVNRWETVDIPVNRHLSSGLRPGRPD
jgi:hypothetical protein